MKKIKLTKGKYALVDNEDYEILSNFKWHTGKGTKKWSRYYAKRRHYLNKGVSSVISMHRQIMNPPKGYVVDHINGDTLDNRRANLRIVTQRENLLNTKGHRSGKLFGFSRNKRNGRYYAQILVNGRNEGLGGYGTPEEAHDAYLKRLKSLSL